MTGVGKRLMFQLLVSVVAVVVCVAVLELAGWWTRGPSSAVSDRYYFMSGDHGVFRNVDDIFVYREHSLIRSRVWFDTDNGFANEYSYQFRTNNLGLVQGTDVHLGKESLLVLGDSFTEGTGSPPWFDDFSRQFPDPRLQPVNGGLLGTGFLHWVRLDQYLRNQGLTPSKAMVVFISDDMSRKRWAFQTGILECLDNWLSCQGWENYYGLPPPERRTGLPGKDQSVPHSVSLCEWQSERVSEEGPAGNGRVLPEPRSALVPPSRSSCRRSPDRGLWEPNRVCTHPSET